MIMMVIVKAGSSSSGRKQIGAGAGAVVCSNPVTRVSDMSGGRVDLIL